jgi:hypothetical protein
MPPRKRSTTLTQLHQHLSQILDLLHGGEDVALGLFGFVMMLITMWQILKAHLK